ncbi:hypothetical protein [Taklimakanibacter lacteus]|uniref:hypothetical protein n=1 Tax=Taklimakanibacter lacteus TaxID=2268456 RepID=UPI0013C4F8B8
MWRVILKVILLVTGEQAARVVPPFPIEKGKKAGYKACIRKDFDAGEGAIFRAQIFRGPHDGLERQSKEINTLEGSVCAACAVSDSALREEE